MIVLQPPSGIVSSCMETGGKLYMVSEKKFWMSSSVISLSGCPCHIYFLYWLIITSIFYTNIAKTFHKTKSFWCRFIFCKKFQEKFSQKKYEKVFLIYYGPESCGCHRIYLTQINSNRRTPFLLGERLARKHKKRGNLFQDCPSRRKLLCTMEWEL